jgi:hypothetical protein
LLFEGALYAEEKREGTRAALVQDFHFDYLPGLGELDDDAVGENIVSTRQIATYRAVREERSTSARVEGPISSSNML